MFERLTKQLDGEPAFIEDESRWGIYNNFGKDILEGEVIDRLAEYEDSGLSPEEVQELVKARAEGRLVVLPCKPNSKLYDTHGRELVIFSIEIGKYGDVLINTVPLGGGVLNTYRPHDFDETVFLSKETAEKALMEKEGAKPWGRINSGRSYGRNSTQTTNGFIPTK